MPDLLVNICKICEPIAKSLRHLPIAKKSFSTCSHEEKVGQK